MLNLTWLFTPATNPARMAKSMGLPVDCIIFDLEDSVPPAEKAAARQNIIESLGRAPAERPRLGVRLNGLGTGFLADDLTAMAGVDLDFVFLPKLETPEELDAFLARLDDSKKAAGATAPPRTYAIVETTLGVINVDKIVFRSDRLAGLMFGAEDFTLSLGVERTKAGAELFYPRSKVGLCCAAAGIEAIDTVFSDVKDEAGLIVEVTAAKQLGFTAKALIHPNQIAPVKRVYAPTEAQAAAAQRQVEGYEAALAKGLAAVAVDGKMIDPPVYQRAKKMVALYQALISKK